MRLSPHCIRSGDLRLWAVCVGGCAAKKREVGSRDLLQVAVDGLSIWRSGNYKDRLLPCKVGRDRSGLCTALY